MYLSDTRLQQSLQRLSRGIPWFSAGISHNASSTPLLPASSLLFTLLHSSALFCTLLHSSALFCTLLHAFPLFCTLFHAVSRCFRLLRPEVRNSCASARPDVCRFRTFGALPGLVFHFLAFLERAEPFRLDVHVMNEKILAPIVGLDETEPLLLIEPLHCALCHGIPPFDSCQACEMRSYHSPLQLPDGTHEYVPHRVFDQSRGRLSRTIDVFCLEWAYFDSATGAS